jgi:ribosomal protein L10
LHKQKYPLIFSKDKEIVLEISQKIQAVCKFIIDRLETLTPQNYAELRKEKKNNI